MNKQPKYKICRRVGEAVFSKCESPRFAASAEKKRPKKKGAGRALSEYGTQLLDKQRVRYTYNLRERQFARYVEKAATKKGVTPAEYLYRTLEARLDNVVYRLGFTQSRASARQMVSHGHIVVNEKKVNLPSYAVRTGDIVRVRKESKDKALFAALPERLKDRITPSWLVLDEKKMEGVIKTEPVPDKAGGGIGVLTSVLGFYGR